VRLLAGLTTAASALALAGCGGGAEEASPPVGLRAADGMPAPGAAEVLERFVEAAARRDSTTMWELLSVPTRASLGPTLEDFRQSAAGDLRRAAGSFVGEPSLVLARAFGPAWAVAAVAGEVEDDDGERDPAAFAAAFRREEAGWRLELDGIYFVGHRPSPLAELDADELPWLGATAQSSGRIDRIVVWLDGEAVGARTRRPLPFMRSAEARPEMPLEPGAHVVTVFAATAETAAAQAWPFVVEP
jgi:hypothetical protein